MAIIENQPQLREIFKEPPIISYRKGKSLKDILVKAKPWKLFFIRELQESFRLVNIVSRVDKVFSWALTRRNKNSALSYDAEFKLLSDVSNSLTSPTKNSSLFDSHHAAMTMITSEMRKAQVPSFPSVELYLVVTLFLCIFISASSGIEILVFRIRICDVTLSPGEGGGTTANFG